MAADDVKRKLSAIFSADVEGYSRLMEEDELATIETLTSHKEIMRKLIRQYRGRVVDSTGDNLLAEFSSVVDAVQCAVEVQQVLSAKNETLPENRRMYFRIGINLGDVVEEGKRIYGDGVNVAARVESLAVGGGISISGTAYDQLGKKLPLGYEYLGEQSVKNIEKPVRVYRILTEAEAAGKVIGEVRPKTKQLRGAAIGGVVVLILVAGALAIWNFYFRPAYEPASEERMAFPLPDKPSIAVLPFANMSQDPNQEYFCDGSKIENMFVIARNSTFSYKGKSVKVNQVAEELGVRYVLEGSVRKAGERVRITAQLIDALSGHHLWAERYEKDLKEIFVIQDEITKNIITTLQVKLTLGEEASLMAKGTDNLNAYLKALQALDHINKMNIEENALAREVCEEAIALDPNFARPYFTLGWTHLIDVFLGSSKSPKKSLAQALELGQKALALDDSLGFPHRLLCTVYTVQRQYDKAIAEGEQAVALAPNSADNLVAFARTLNFAGRSEEAILLIKKAIRLNPFAPTWYFFLLGHVYCVLGQYEDAIIACKKALNRQPDNLIAHIFLAVAYASLGKEEEARTEIEEVLGLNPEYSVKHFTKAFAYKNQTDRARIVDALRKAGLPETPPLPLPDKPSIAVLPFVNMSGDPEQEYFSDGITEEIITALSKVPKLFVIARHSAFTYKGKPIWVPTVGRELGVRYVLEGSVRKSGDKLRITAQLIEAATNKHLWAERYGRDLRDIFAIQDEITKKIITALQVKLTEGEQARLYAKGTDNLDAYLKLLKSLEYLFRMNREDNIRARKMAEEAITSDPGYAAPYAILSATHHMDVWFRSTKSPKQSLALALELAQKALSLDESIASAHTQLANVYLLKRQHEKALAEAEQALALEPNSAFRHASLARTLIYDGRPEEAVPLLKRALRLSPIPEGFTLYTLGFAYNLTGQYEKAIEACRKAIGVEPENLYSHVVLTTAYSLAGREEEARSEASEVLRINPKFSLEHFAKTMPFKNDTDKDPIITALHRAGLK
jgi:adenylate cyclase